MNRRRVALFFLLLYAVPGVFMIFYHLVAAPRYVTGWTRLLGGLANLAGPWATLLAKPIGWPNGGEFFNLPLAIGASLALAAVVIAPLVTTTKIVRVVCMGLAVPFVLGWYALGLVQLMNCAV